MCVCGKNGVVEDSGPEDVEASFVHLPLLGSQTGFLEKFRHMQALEQALDPSVAKSPALCLDCLRRYVKEPRLVELDRRILTLHQG